MYNYICKIYKHNLYKIKYHIHIGSDRLYIYTYICLSRCKDINIWFINICIYELVHLPLLDAIPAVRKKLPNPARMGHVGPYGPIWAHMGPYGLIWARMASHGPIKQFIFSPNSACTEGFLLLL